MERRDAVEQGRAVMYTHAHKMSRTFCHRPSHIHLYHTRGRTLLSQAPHTNESILCHDHSPRTIIVTCSSRTVDPTDPERSRTPTAELHQSGTMMPRHTIGNPRHETPDLRRPVSITTLSQTAPYSVLDTTGPGQISQMPGTTAHPKFHRKYPVTVQVKRQSQVPSWYIIAKVRRQSQIP